MHVFAHRIPLLVCLVVGTLLIAALAEAADQTPPRHEFVNIDLWPDDHGQHINAHGGGILFHDGVYYWFGEHKIAGRGGNQANVGVRCYSSKDLYNWKNEGVALAVAEESDSEIARGCILERPKVIYNAKTKQFVMWFHLELLGQGYKAARTGLAVADKVTGPYAYQGSVRPNAGQWPENMSADEQARAKQLLAKGAELEEPHAIRAGGYTARDFKGGQMARDMTLFVDDDGTAYHIHASEENYTLHISELTPDYRDFTGRYARVLPGGKNEAPAIFKHHGRYYLLTSGCTGWRPNAARSFVADSIWGPWKSLGNPCVGEEPESGLGAEKTFGGQSTFILPMPGHKDQYIAMFDIWRPRDAIDGRYLWLPIQMTPDSFQVRYQKRWSLPKRVTE